MKNRFLALSIALPLCLSLAAAGPQAAAAPAPSDTATIYLAPSPRYDHLSRISSGLTISSLGRADCGGSFTTYDEYDSTMTMVLQQFNGSKWVDVKEWSEDFAGSGVKMMEKGYYVSSGHRYRLTVIVEILDDDGTVLETATCDSPIEEY